MIRVRFAPSPTGYLHVGGVRTALFNWMFARKTGGKFILRIEDTDTMRSSESFEKQIYQSLRWCGLDWDEGPDQPGPCSTYLQMERFRQGVYQEYFQKLVKLKKAHFVIYSKENPKKEIATSAEYPNQYASKGHEITIRFPIPSGQTQFEDLLKGNMVYENEALEDFLIMKSNGIPVYNFAAVVDDHLMGITHVIRGEDHLSNAPKQAQLYRAFGWEPPLFMHIPLILGNDRTPLSKRHGGTSVEYFEKSGYLSDGLMNYLALLGWSVDDDEIFLFAERVNAFSLSKMTNRSVIFDYRKLEWINGQHLRKCPVEKLASQYSQWVKDTGRDLETLGTFNRLSTGRKEYLLNICREKVNTLEALHEFTLPFLLKDDQFPYEPEYVQKYRNHTMALEILQSFIVELDQLPYSVEGIEKALRLTAEKTGAGTKRVFQTVRGAITGRMITPGLYDSIYVMGKEKCLRRVQRTMSLVSLNAEG